MARLLTEGDVRRLFEGLSDAEILARATDWVERAFVEHHEGKLSLHRRVHIDYPEGRGYYDGSAMRILPAIVPAFGLAGFRAYAIHHGDGQVLAADRARDAVIDHRLAAELLVLYDYHDDMRLLAIMSDHLLTILRTAAPTGLFVRFLARQDSRVLGFFGAGKHAYHHIRAVLNERPAVEEIRLYNRTPGRRDTLAAKLAAEVAPSVIAVDRPEQAVTGCDIVITCTNAGRPVFDGAWLSPGTHVTQVARGEIDAATVRRARVVLAWKEQILYDTPPMEPYGALVESGELRADAVGELSEVVAGAAPGRRSDEEITLCPTQGMAMWDIAIGKLAYTLALEKGIGAEFDFHAGVY